MNLNKLAGFAAGPIGSAALGLITLPLISWYFDAADLGGIALLQTVASLILIAFGLGQDQAYIREYHASEDKAALLKTVLLPPAVLLAAGCALIALNPVWPSEKIFEQPDPRLALFSLMFCAALVCTRYLSVILRMQERAWAFSFSQLAPKLLLPLMLLITHYYTDSLYGHTALVSIFACAQLLTAALLLLQTRRALWAALRAPFQTALMRANLRYGAPLALAGLAYWGLVSVDRLMLKQYAGLDAVGLYSLATNFAAIALIIQSIFSTVWAPTLFGWVHRNENLHRVGDIFRLLLGLVLAVLCLTGLASPLAAWLLPPHYADVPFVLLSAMLYPLLYTLTEVSGIGINVSRQTRLSGLIALLAMSANCALCYWLIPRWGAQGAACATAVSFWLFFALKTEAGIRLWRPLPRLSTYGATFSALLCSTAYTLFGNRDNYPLFALLWLAALMLLLWLYRRDLSALIAFIQKRLP